MFNKRFSSNSFFKNEWIYTEKHWIYNRKIYKDIFININRVKINKINNIDYILIKYWKLAPKRNLCSVQGYHCKKILNLKFKIKSFFEIHSSSINLSNGLRFMFK